MPLNLKKRDRNALYVMVGIILIFLILKLILLPVFEKRKRLSRMIIEKTRVLAELKSRKSEYESILNNSDSLKSDLTHRERGFTLFSFLDKLAGNVGVKNNITYMKPSTIEVEDSGIRISNVEMKLKGITINQIRDYLYLIETSKNIINIRRFSISKKGKQDEFIDAVLLVETHIL